MAKEIDHQIARLRAGHYDPLAALERLLSITAIDVLFETVEDLLNICPDISRAQAI